MARLYKPPELKQNESYGLTEQHYEQVEVTAAPSLRSEVKETKPSLPDTPAALVKIPDNKKNMTRSAYLVIVAVTLLSVLTLSLVAVIIYSTAAKTSSQDDLSQRVQQLERQLSKLQVIQATNFTVDQLFGLKDTQESMADKINHLSLFDSSVTSQLTSVQSLVQTLSQIQNNVVNDLSSLRTVNVFENCIEETRLCTISVPGTYYWRQCQTSGIQANRVGYYTLGMRCDYEYSGSNYLQSTIIRKSGTYVYCQCHVTYPNPSSDGHRSLSTSSSGTCTLTVTRCPLSENILANVN